MNWTAPQQQAIDERNKNILVSAAAGSGKTAVLVERIRKLIIEDGIPIDHMLIVTFTNAAASEMKEKIRKSINKEIDADPENSEMLRRQLSLLPKANISTFHSFALDVIRKFFYLTDVNPGFRICDEAQSSLLREESMDELIESWFEKDSSEFYKFLDWYSTGRGTGKVREMVMTCYNVLMSMPDPWTWLDDSVAVLGMTKDEFSGSSVMELIWRFTDESIKTAAQCYENAADILSEAGLDRLAAKVIDEEQGLCSRLAETAARRDFDGMAAALTSLDKMRIVAGKAEKADYEPIKGAVAAARDEGWGMLTGLKDGIFRRSLAEQTDELNQVKPEAEMLAQLLRDFDEIFREAKQSRKFMDFNDIERYCLQILADEQAAAYYRKKFDCIFIDEYQDTNRVQEKIIDMVRREDNLFMVGDIKQSIYRFRLAEPKLFEARRARYEAESGTGLSEAIDLNSNYRSKSRILSGVNDLFAGLMKGYDAKAALYPGIEYDGELNFPPELKIIDMSSAKDADEAIADMKAAEIEALEAVKLIRENLGREYYDAAENQVKKLGLRDIVILMRSVKSSAEIFYNTFKASGIDSFIDDTESYFDTMEINVFMDLLSVIDNKLQDVPLLAALHSEIFGFTADELGMVRAQFKEGAYSEAFMAYAESGSDEVLRTKCSNSLASIMRWKQMAAAMPLPEFIWKLLLETGYYMVMGAMPGGAQRQANLRALVDRAQGYSEDGQGTLYSFVRYIDAVKTRDISMGQVKMAGENDPLVRIMTIHKSKGLEFPMVIICGLGRTLNYTGVGSSAVMNYDIGLGMTLCNHEEHWHRRTIMQDLIGMQTAEDEYAEEMRVLYVAMTRAKELLYLVGTVKKPEKYEEMVQAGVHKKSNYLGMILDTFTTEMIDCDSLSGVAAGIAGTLTDGGDIFASKAEAADAAEAVRRLEYVYPYEKARQIRSKYSVSELNKERAAEALAHSGTVSPAADEDSFTEGGFAEAGFELQLAVPKFRQGEHRLTAAERGTVYHGIMERIDFSRAEAEGSDYIKTAAEGFVDDGIFLREEIDAVDFDRVTGFFRTDLGKRCAEAYRKGLLERERPFDLMTDYAGERVIVQGIMDCFFREEDGCVLIDYKTNRIDGAKPFEEEAARLRDTYSEQIKLYSEALEAAKGTPVKEAYLYLFDAGRMINMEG